MSAKASIEKIKRKTAVATRIATREAAKEIIQVVIDVIKIRARLEGEGGKGKFKKLEPSTIAIRERYERNLSKDTTPETSNLTATGQLLDAITGKSVGGKVTITVKKTKRKRELSGSRSGLTNEQVRSYVENEREFLTLNEQDKDEVIKVATEIVKEKLRDLLK
jgi:hypothetical protein